MTTYTQISGQEYLFDAHCHLSPGVTHTKYNNLKLQLSRKVDFERGFNIQKRYCLNMMSTNFIDYSLIHDLSENFPWFVNPNYGVHPWFSHLFTFENFDQEDGYLTTMEIKRKHYSSIFQPSKEISDELLMALPVPIYFPEFIKRIEQLLLENPKSGIGEIGIDKVFRVPQCGYLGVKECQEWIDNPKLKSKVFECTDRSPFRTSMEHQVKILRQFLLLAKKLHRHISLHCVGNDGKLFNILKEIFGGGNGKTYSSEWIDLHSYSGSIEQIRVYTKSFPNIKFSISKVLNLERYKERLRKAFELHYVGVQNILLESDLGLDGLYWEQRQNQKCEDDRYEFLISRKEGAQNRHTGLLKDTFEQLEKLGPGITLQKLDKNYAEYLSISD
ncbi:DEBR0S1_25202g1_1 [Brettanomyces bruxellensis]|uniref:DEBR0S1_25202g1_1 n=1 Tax=Dekkera bruxellensis TaxID=5007 RepID=A0A7D9CX72_DEKBR|nr:DEBR0S1_25202g1_1 [Brettanomyces bruxellensis]